MMIKLLIGVYGDAVNAQNINGIEIAKRLNPEEYDIHMFYYESKPAIKGITFHKTTNGKILKNIKKISNILMGKYDLIYLPRCEKVDIFASRIPKIKSKIISSLEIENALHDAKLKEFFCENIKGFFAINNDLQQKTKENWGKEIPIIPLGYSKMNVDRRKHNELKRVAFVGSLIERKRPGLIVDCAVRFPMLEFVIIGNGPLYTDLKNRIKQENITNLQLLGQVENKKVYQELSNCDLLLIVSTNEGQPKVSLEAASMGVPTCYIKNTYSIDYIVDQETGFEAKDQEEVTDIIQMLLENPNKLEHVSENIVPSIEGLDWDCLIQRYDQYFRKIVLNG